MKLETLVLTLMLIVGLAVVSVSHGTQPTVMAAQVESAAAIGRGNQSDASQPRSGIVGFLLSQRGHTILRASSHPMAGALLRRLGEEPQAAAPAFPASPPAGFPAPAPSPPSIRRRTPPGAPLNQN